MLTTLSIVSLDQGRSIYVPDPIATEDFVAPPAEDEARHASSGMPTGRLGSLGLASAGHAWLQAAWGGRLIARWLALRLR